MASGRLHTEVVIRSRVDYAVFCAAGIAAALAYLWLPDVALLVVGTIVAVLAGAALIADARRGPDWRQQRQLVRGLWEAANRIPPGQVLADPGTGDLVSVERQRGWLTLAVAGRPPGRPPVVARYMIGRWGGPVRPPVLRHLAAPGEVPSALPGLRRRAAAADAGARPGPEKASTAELARLSDLVQRTAVLRGSLARASAGRRLAARAAPLRHSLRAAQRGHVDGQCPLAPVG